MAEPSPRAPVPPSDPMRSVVLVFASGVALGAVVATLSVVAWVRAQPEARPALPAPVVCTAEPCAACPACPASEPQVPVVREPVQPQDSDSPAAPSGPSTGSESVSPRSCEHARTHPMQVSDSKLAECARQNMLGSCHVYPRCPTCACQEYVATDELCQDGKCGPPLSGTGCASAAYYGGTNPFFNCSGDEQAVAGCMVRKLAKAGYCKKQ